MPSERGETMGLMRLLALLAVVAVAAACGGDDDGGGDGDADSDSDSDGDGDGDGYSGTWEQVGCASSVSCEDVDCPIPVTDDNKRTISFPGGGVALLSLGDGDPVEARLEGDRICNDIPGGGEACFQLANCGEFLLYCLMPDQCEKLQEVN